MAGIRRKNILIVIGVVAALYLLLGVLLHIFQAQLLFHPKAVAKTYRFQFSEKYQEFTIENGGDRISAIRFVPKKESKGTVLFFHGNMENVDRYAQYPTVFLRNGFEIWMVDYPGFGKTQGELMEKNIYRQALKFDSLVRSKTPGKKVIIYGKSIGTGIASYVAMNRGCSQLILETPYYNIDALARTYFPFFPVMPMTKFSFPTNRYLPKLNSRITIFHGTEDEVIPFAHATRLKKENAKIELISIYKGGHNNLWGFAEYNQKMDALLK